MHFGNAERSPSPTRTFVTRETKDHSWLPNVRGMPEMLKIEFSLRLRSVINLRLCFAVAWIQDVPVYGWVDKVSKYLQNWVHNKCDLSADWAWFSFLEQYDISLLNFQKCLITISRQVLLFLMINKPYYCIVRHGTSCEF
jgi:hypothetical protein